MQQLLGGLESGCDGVTQRPGRQPVDCESPAVVYVTLGHMEHTALVEAETGRLIRWKAHEAGYLLCEVCLTSILNRSIQRILARAECPVCGVVPSRLGELVGELNPISVKAPEPERGPSRKRRKGWW